MIEKFSAQELKTIKRELDEQEKLLKKDVARQMSLRLKPVRDRWNEQNDILRKKYGGILLTKAHQDVGHKLSNTTYKDIVGTVLRLCKCSKVAEIPEGLIPMSINIGSLLVDGYFYKVKNRLEKYYGTTS